MDKRVFSVLFKLILIVSLILLFTAIVLKVFFLKSRIVIADSMAPALLEGDQLLCWRLALPAHNAHPEAALRAALKVKDIIVIRPGNETEDLIKRVIGLPGDTVEMKAEGVFVNNKKLCEEYLPASGGATAYLKYTIPANGVFVLGDHRALSRDSREFGIVHVDEIKEKVLFRFYPPARIGIVR